MKSVLVELTNLNFLIPMCYSGFLKRICVCSVRMRSADFRLTRSKAQEYFVYSEHLRRRQTEICASRRADKNENHFQFFIESLILAQDERWRRA